MSSNKGSASSASRLLRVVPTALKLGPSAGYGSKAPWYMGVVLQQACQAMVRRAP